MHLINQQLLDDGWRVWPCPYGEKRKTFFAKSFAGHAKCKCNAPKNKQVEIYHSHAGRWGSVDCPDVWSVHLCGKLPDNEWLRTEVQGLDDIDTIYRTVDQLLKIWDYAVSIAPTIEKPD